MSAPFASGSCRTSAHRAWFVLAAALLLSGLGTPHDAAAGAPPSRAQRLEDRFNWRYDIGHAMFNPIIMKASYGTLKQGLHRLDPSLEEPGWKWRLAMATASFWVADRIERWHEFGGIPGLRSVYPRYFNGEYDLTHAKRPGYTREYHQKTDAVWDEGLGRAAGLAQLVFLTCNLDFQSEMTSNAKENLMASWYLIGPALGRDGLLRSLRPQVKWSVHAKGAVQSHTALRAHVLDSGLGLGVSSRERTRPALGFGLRLQRDLRIPHAGISLRAGIGGTADWNIRGGFEGLSGSTTAGIVLPLLNGISFRQPATILPAAPLSDGEPVPAANPPARANAAG